MLVNVVLNKVHRAECLQKVIAFISDACYVMQELRRNVAKVLNFQGRGCRKLALRQVEATIKTYQPWL